MFEVGSEVELLPHITSEALREIGIPPGDAYIIASQRIGLVIESSNTFPSHDRYVQFPGAADAWFIRLDLMAPYDEHKVRSMQDTRSYLEAVAGGINEV